ncbi:hypothetical protein GCM10011349_03340 [Novosphingobium indicum]|uniref:Uncharacterized protein n=1 Tax=Novosphingobium indicum TaxID=462949 RepID=A0ABQ2J880_9SPHN|nr:hypothetical protein [Novosphingobium indicum]GGN41348.1 hypothetical protein GCM10011349_03340 [Novosphingobium indicum]
MDSNPHSKGGSLSRSGRPQFGLGSASALSMKWSALHDAAGAVATIAGVACAPLPAEVRNFPAVMRDEGGSRRAMAEQHIEDLSAIMEAGLSALLSALARGVDPRGGAKALWREFLTARDAMLALAPQGSGGPRRAA